MNMNGPFLRFSATSIYFVKFHQAPLKIITSVIRHRAILGLLPFETILKLKMLQS